MVSLRRRPSSGSADGLVKVLNGPARMGQVGEEVLIDRVREKVARS